MKAAFQYCFDSASHTWQIVSRSGHVIYESRCEDKVRRLARELAQACRRRRTLRAALSTDCIAAWN